MGGSYRRAGTARLGKLSDEADLRFEMEVEFFLDRLLRYGNQLANITCRCSAEIDHDVGVDMGNLGIAMPISPESTLINQPSGANTLDFLEDGSGAGVKVKPGMPAPPPAQILLHHLVHCRGITGQKLKRDGESYVTTAMKNACVIAEFHVVTINYPPRSLLSQDFC